MTEKAEASRVVANVIRTMPYTAYLSALSYGIVFGSDPAFHLFAALVLNECVNHALKFVIKNAFGKNSEWVRRPDGAADTGIYPQHTPRASTSSGMPSGHAQTAFFLATVLTASATEEAAAAAAGSSRVRGPWHIHFLYGLAVVVALSRTRYGGPYLSVVVDGSVRACHTPAQVLAGGMLGIMFGLIAIRLYYG